MTTSNYMPDVRVEVAFEAGWSTPAADRAWTDISDWVELRNGIDITHGRTDELSTAEPNRLTLTVDNRDGRFSPGRVFSPYYPNVKIGRPIRVMATLPGGAESVRFLGFVDEWPLEWDGVGTQAYTAITATSRMARLNSSPLRSTADAEILAAGPVVYWPLTEAAGATEGLDMVAVGPSLRSYRDPDTSDVRVVFGGDPVLDTDDLPAVTMTIGGQSLRGYNAGQLTQTTDLTMAAAFRVTAEDGLVTLYPTIFRSPDNSELVAAFLTEDSLWWSVKSSTGTEFNSADLPYDVWDGEPHVVVLTYTGAATNGVVRVYLDGDVLLANTLGTSVFESTLTDVQTGLFTAASAGANEGLQGQLGRVALWHEVLSAADVATVSTAMLDGFPEQSGERVERYAAYAGIVAAEVDAETGEAEVTHVDTAGQAPLSVLRVVESTEGGVLFDAKDGTLGFHSRGRRYTAETSFTLDIDAQEVGSDYSPRFDRSQLHNDVTVSLRNGRATTRYFDQGSIDDYGPAGGSVEVASPSVTAPYERATWLVNTYSEPVPRVPSLSVDLLVLDRSVQTAILDASIGTRFTVDGQPGQAASLVGDYFIEGWSEHIGPESYSFTLNVSDAAPFVNTIVLDDPVRSELDSTVYTVAY